MVLEVRGVQEVLRGQKTGTAGSLEMIDKVSLQEESETRSGLEGGPLVGAAEVSLKVGIAIATAMMTMNALAEDETEGIGEGAWNPTETETWRTGTDGLVGIERETETEIGILGTGSLVGTKMTTVEGRNLKWLIRRALTNTVTQIIQRKPQTPSKN